MGEVSRSFPFCIFNRHSCVEDVGGGGGPGRWIATKMRVEQGKAGGVRWMIEDLSAPGGVCLGKLILL